MGSRPVQVAHHKKASFPKLKKPLAPSSPWSRSGRAPPPLGLRRWFGGPLPLPSVASWRRCHPLVRALGPSAGRYPALPAPPSSPPSGLPFPAGLPPSAFTPAFSPRRSRGGSSSNSSKRRSRRRRWPGSPWRTVKEAARRKSATTMMVRHRAGGRVGGPGLRRRARSRIGSAAAVASGCAGC